MVVLIFECVENNGVDSLLGIASYGLHGNLRRTPTWEVENASGDAAERDGVEAVVLGDVEAGAVARGQLLLLLTCRSSVGDDGADGVDDIFCRKVEARRDLGRARRLLVALRPHDAVAGLTQLDACGGVDGVVDAAVQGDEAAEQLAVGGIDDGVDLEPGDVALPHQQALALRLHDTLVGKLPLQLPVLPPQKLLGGGQRRPHIRARMSCCLPLRSWGIARCWPPSFIRLLMSMSRLSSLAVSFSDIPVCFCVVGEVVVFEEGRRGPEVVMVHQLDVHLEISEFVVAGVEPWQYGVVVVNPPRRGIVDVKVSPSAALHEHVALAGHDFYVGILVQLLVHLLLGRGGKVERGALLLHDLEHADVRPSSLAGGKGHLNV